MSQVFLISDTHFFHHKVVEFGSRPYANVEEMNEGIVDNWNRVVTKRDSVWHLGDLCFGPVGNLRIVDRLNGIKNLIMGNHDKYGVRAYADYFNKIEGAKKYDGFILTHIPIHPDQFYRWSGNVHGHLHSGQVMSFDDMYDDKPVPDERYFNVSCERVNHTPMAWEDIKEKFK
jgi:calcineurin-like phosphoesterase family protein